MSNPGRDFWDKKRPESHLDDQSISLIKRGLEVRPDRSEGNSFWDDFITVIGNNSEGAAKLLGVSRDVVAGWSSKVREGLNRVRDENDNEDKKPEMSKTGDD